MNQKITKGLYMKPLSRGITYQTCFLSMIALLVVLYFLTYYSCFERIDKSFRMSLETQIDKPVAQNTTKINDFVQVNMTAPELKCWNDQLNVLQELEDSEPVPGHSIFFHETSCPKVTYDISLSPRQACCVESAAKANPGTDVFLLVSAPALVTDRQTRNPLVQQLLTYSNFKVRYINFARYLSDTPVDNLRKSGVLNKSKYPIIHASDILRFVTLYKFGGTYLDLDIIVLKSLANITNYACVESDSFVTNGILNFGFDFVGREMARSCAEELSATYKPEDWGYNGPGLMTRVLQVRCGSQTTDDMIDNLERCKDFHVCAAKMFMPHPYPQSDLFFKDGNTQHFWNITKDSYSIHLWNALTKDIVLKNGSDIPFLKFAERYCPKVYGVVGNHF